MIRTIWKEGVVCLMGYILPVDNNIAKNYAQRMMKTEKEPLKLDKIKKIDLNTEQIQINYDKSETQKKSHSGWEQIGCYEPTQTTGKGQVINKQV